MNIKILGHEISVIFPEIRDEELMGCFIPEFNQIEIHTTNPKLAQTVFLHEIVEAINYFLELNLKHSQITSLETGLNQVFEENPRILESLKRAANERGKVKQKVMEAGGEW